MIETSGNDKFRRALIGVVVSMGIEPWKDNSDWVTCAEVMSEFMGYKVSRAQARSQYRRLINYLERNDISIKEYVEDVVYTQDINFSDILEPEEPSEISKAPHVEVEEANNAFDKLVEATGVDTDLFEVSKGSVWGSKRNLNASFQFKRRTLPKEEQVRKLLDELEGREPTEFPVPKYEMGDHIALASIYDVHLERAGMDGTGMEATARKFREVIGQFGIALDTFPVEEIVFIVGNDFTNTDNPHGTTTKGTRQENSVHWRYGVNKQCELVIYASEFFLNYAPLRILMVPGNHGLYSNYWLGKYLEAYFKYADNIIVDNGELTRKYYSFGENGFMFLHGNEEVKSTLPSLFAKEAPDAMFYNCDNLEIHTGHMHTRKESFQLISEEHGIIIREHPSLSSTSDWESLRGFTENNRAGILSLYNRSGKITSDWYAQV